MARPVQIRFDSTPNSGYVKLVLENVLPEGEGSRDIIAAMLAYPRQGQVVGEEPRNVRNAGALNLAAGPLNRELARLCS